MNPYIIRVLTLSAPGDSDLPSDHTADTFVVDMPFVVDIKVDNCQLDLPRPNIDCHHERGSNIEVQGSILDLCVCA